MKIQIIYEHKVRELDFLHALENELVKCKCRVKLFQINFQLIRFIIDCIWSKPDIIIVPMLKSKRVLSVLAFIQFFNKSVKYIDLHQEQITCKKNSNLLIPDNDFTINSVYHFCWGEYFASRLRQIGVSNEKIFITGNPRNDPNFITKTLITKEELAKSYGLDQSKTWILFAENRGWYACQPRSTVVRILKRLNYSEQEIDAVLVEEKESLRVFEHELLILSEDLRFRNIEFIYRIHPATDLLISIPNGVHSISKLSISHWINACDMFITCESTSIFEADMIGKQCYRHNTLHRDSDLIIDGILDYPEVGEMSNLFDRKFVSQSYRNNQQIYKKYMGDNSIRTVDAYVNAILKIHSCNECIRFRPKFSFVYFGYQILFEIVSWVGIKTKLLYKTRIPRVAYALKDDIPIQI